MKKDSDQRNKRRSMLMTGTLAGAAALLLLPATASAEPTSKPFWSGPAKVLAWGGGHGGKRGHRLGRRGRRGKRGKRGLARKLERMKKHLNLTPFQVKKVKQIHQSKQAKMAKLRLQKRRIRAKMRVEWLAHNPNLGTLKALHQQMVNVKQKMAKQRFQVRLKIYKILTPQQRKKLQAAPGRFGGRFSKRFKRGRRGKRFGGGRF